MTVLPVLLIIYGTSGYGITKPPKPRFKHFKQNKDEKNPTFPSANFIEGCVLHNLYRSSPRLRNRGQINAETISEVNLTKEKKT